MPNEPTKPKQPPKPTSSPKAPKPTKPTSSPKAPKPTSSPKAPKPTKRYWVMKSEPDTFSFGDLERMPDGFEHWDGVRNYQARNFLCAQKIGDAVLFYHSNTKVPGVVGIAKVVREAYPDHTAFDPLDHHYDPKSKPEKPTWFMTDITAVRPLERIVSLHEMQELEELVGLQLIQRGNRLSVMEISKAHFDAIVARERVKV
jgi:predicted RNA-binding protein with PUA-like domain